MKPDVLYVAAGACFAASWFIFADGLTFASRNGAPYEFQMWLPGILCLLATFIFMFADPNDIQGEEDFMGGYSDEDKQNRAKLIFFFGSSLILAGVSVAIWKLADTYPGSDTCWPGIALILQCSMVGVMNALLIAARTKKEDTLM